MRTAISALGRTRVVPSGPEFRNIIFDESRSKNDPERNYRYRPSKNTRFTILFGGREGSRKFSL